MRAVENEKGLTLIELLAVIVILGIIAAIAVPAIGGIIEKSRTQAFVSNAYSFKNASTYYLKEQIFHETSPGAKITYKQLVDAGFLEEVKDPDTGKHWDPETNDSYVTVTGEKVAEVCLYGEKRRLCSRKDGDGLTAGPAPFDELSEDLVTSE